VNSVSPCGYVGKCQPLKLYFDKERERAACAARCPLPRSPQSLCLCLVIQAQSLMGGTNRVRVSYDTRTLPWNPAVIVY